MLIARQRACVCVAFAVSVLGPTVVSAQAAAQAGTQAPSAIPTIREQVEVVATRLPETPHEVPAAIEVISGDQIRAMGATTLRGALALAAGVDVAPGGDAGPAGSVPQFWGLQEFDAFLLVVDGIPWGGAFNPALTTLNLRDIDHIEVLRGSAPVTFGATSFVGVIHVVHKNGAAAGGSAAFRGGSYSSGGAAFDATLPAMGSWKSRVGVDFDRQGFSDDRTSYTRGHASWRGATGEQNHRSWFTADLNWLGQDPASPHPREGASLSSQVAVDSNYNPSGAFLDNTRIAGAYGTERTIGGAAVWSLTASYAHSSQRIFRGFLTDISNTPNNATGFRENIGIDDIYVDSHVAWPERLHVKFVVGADYTFGNGEGTGATFVYTVPLSATPPTQVAEPTTLNLDTGARRNFFGGYALAEYSPVPRVKLSAGLRLNITSESHGEGVAVTNTRPSGSLGVLFGLWEQGPDHVRAYANYRNTFKPAAFDFSLAENEGVLKPETAQSVEGGLKVRAANGRVDFEVSAFRMDFENLVTSTVVGGLPALINAGQTRFQGLDLGSELHFGRDVSGRVNYSFHDGTFVDFVQAFDGVPQQLGGNRFEMSARHLFTAGIVVAPERGFVGSFIVKYTGDRYLNMRNTALAEPFTTLDIGAGYRAGRWELRVDGRNLTDRRDPVSESELGDAQYYLMSARRVDVTFGVRF